jgi:hypothetical protein
MKIILGLLVFIYSCTEINKKPSESINNSGAYNRIIDSIETFNLYKSDFSKNIKKINDLKTKALKLGDTSAYYQLSGYYLFNLDDPDGLFMISYEMATKYHYSKAYFDLFYILHINNKKKILDDCTNNMAMFYLLLAYEKNNENSQYFVGEIFKGKNIPSSESYKKAFCY